MFQVQVSQTYTPQVWPKLSSNPWPVDHDNIYCLWDAFINRILILRDIRSIEKTSRILEVRVNMHGLSDRLTRRQLIFWHSLRQKDYTPQVLPIRDSNPRPLDHKNILCNGPWDTFIDNWASGVLERKELAHSLEVCSEDAQGSYINWWAGIWYFWLSN